MPPDMSPAASRPRLIDPASRLVVAVAVYALVPVVLLLGIMPSGRNAWWELAMSLGVVGAGGLALLPLLSVRWWAQHYRDAVLLRLVQHLHRDLAWWLGGFVLLHVLAILWIEPRTLAYLLPAAPGYMLAGLGSVVLLLALNVTSLARFKRRWSQAGWRRWHAGMSVLALAGMAWHLLGAGYYFGSLAGRCVLLWLVGVPTLLALYWRFSPAAVSPAGSQRGRSARRIGSLATLAVLGCLLAAALWLALAVSEHPASTRHYPCPAGRCL